MPPPKVTSSLVEFFPRAEPLACDRHALEKVTEAAFGQRRKMLRQSLKTLGGDPAAAAGRRRDCRHRARRGNSGRGLCAAGAPAMRRGRERLTDGVILRRSAAAPSTKFCDILLAHALEALGRQDRAQPREALVESRGSPARSRIPSSAGFPRRHCAAGALITSGVSSARRSRRAFSSSAVGGSTNTLTTSARTCLVKLLRALPVDVEQHVAALVQRMSRPARAACRRNCRAPRPIPATRRRRA